MNKKKRAELSKAVTLLMGANTNLLTAKEIVEDVRDQEDEDLYNMPESRQESEAGEAMQDNIDSLDEAAMEIESALDIIDEQIDHIQEVIDK